MYRYSESPPEGHFVAYEYPTRRVDSNGKKLVARLYAGAFGIEYDFHVDGEDFTCAPCAYITPAEKAAAIQEELEARGHGISVEARKKKEAAASAVATEAASEAGAKG